MIATSSTLTTDPPGQSHNCTVVFILASWEAQLIVSPRWLWGTSRLRHIGSLFERAKLTGRVSIPSHNPGKQGKSTSSVHQVWGSVLDLYRNQALGQSFVISLPLDDAQEWATFTRQATARVNPSLHLGSSVIQDRRLFVTPLSQWKHSITIPLLARSRRSQFSYLRFLLSLVPIDTPLPLRVPIQRSSHATTKHITAFFHFTLTWLQHQTTLPSPLAFWPLPRRQTSTSRPWKTVLDHKKCRSKFLIEDFVVEQSDSAQWLAASPLSIACSSSGSDTCWQ